jgi:hypothetical protein
VTLAEASLGGMPWTEVPDAMFEYPLFFASRYGRTGPALPAQTAMFRWMASSVERLIDEQAASFNPVYW